LIADIKVENNIILNVSTQYNNCTSQNSETQYVKTKAAIGLISDPNITVLHTCGTFA